MKRRVLLSLGGFALSCFAAPLLLGQVQVNGDGNWPQEIDTDGTHLVIYQPSRQLEGQPS